jgi:hypothetical protein
MRSSDVPTTDFRPDYYMLMAENQSMFTHGAGMRSARVAPELPGTGHLYDLDEFPPKRKLI